MKKVTIDRAVNTSTTLPVRQEFKPCLGPDCMLDQEILL